MGGWGRRFLNVTPSGKVLPRHAAETLPGLRFPTVGEASLTDIWYNSAALARFRGTAWMDEPCRSCERREIDWGGVAAAKLSRWPAMLHAPTRPALCPPITRYSRLRSATPRK
jgi:PqqA peptide cyclase